MTERYPGEHAFEDLMNRSEPRGEEFFLVDIAAELHISEADLGYFAWSHLPDKDYNPHAGTLTVDGAEALRTFLGREN